MHAPSARGRAWQPGGRPRLDGPCGRCLRAAPASAGVLLPGRRRAASRELAASPRPPRAGGQSEARDAAAGERPLERALVARGGDPPIAVRLAVLVGVEGG